MNPETALAPSKCPSYIRCTGTASSDPTPLKHPPCAVILLGAKSFQCLSSRAHFASFRSNVSAPVLSLTLSLKLSLTIIIIIIAHFLCRGRFLRMSKLPCSFLLICVECLSSRAQAHAQAQAQAQHHHHHHHHHCSFPMPMQIPSNVSAPVLIAADLCRMSQLPCSGSRSRSGESAGERASAGESS